MDQKSIIKKFVKKVVHSFQPQAIILFGSRARGDQLKHSDFDFIIISEQFKNIKWRDRISEIVRLWDADENIDIIPYTPKEFLLKSKQSSTIRNAIKDAHILHGQLEVKTAHA